MEEPCSSSLDKTGDSILPTIIDLFGGPVWCCQQEDTEGAGVKLRLSDAGPHTSPLHWWLCLQETHIRSLGREDPLEKGMATHSSILAWRIPWTEEPGGLQSTGLQTVGGD